MTFGLGLAKQYPDRIKHHVIENDRHLPILQKNILLLKVIILVKFYCHVLSCPVLMIRLRIYGYLDYIGENLFHQYLNLWDTKVARLGKFSHSYPVHVACISELLLVHTTDVIITHVHDRRGWSRGVCLYNYQMRCDNFSVVCG